MLLILVDDGVYVILTSMSLLLDRYEIIRVIGNGGMGAVYEAREVTSGRRVAVKWMHEHSFSDGDPNLLRFQQEARIAGSLDSPHVTAVYECAREPQKNVVFQVLELLEGEDLHVLLERVGALDPTIAVHIAVQACKGLSAAHTAGVIHRDIKPDNIFLSQNGDHEVIVKLLDFGIAKIRQSKDAPRNMTAPINSMTASGDLLGTPLYMAPEQFEGAKHVDARADVYSMGVTLYAMLTGAPPHGDAKSFMQILRAITTNSAPPLRQIAPWVRPAIVTVVEKAMQSNRELRYANATEMLAALTNLAEENPGLTREMLVGITPERKNAPSIDPVGNTINEPARHATQNESAGKGPWWRKLLQR